MDRVFPPVLLACVAEARAPEPCEMVVVTHRIWREAFPHDASATGWERAWCIACTALGGAVAPGWYGPTLTAEMIVTYQVSLTASGGTVLDAEVHASATVALDRVRELNDAGAEVTIMGPYGEKLSLEALTGLVSAEGKAVIVTRVHQATTFERWQLIMRALEEDHMAIKARSDEARIAHNTMADLLRKRADDLLIDTAEENGQ